MVQSLAMTRKAFCRCRCEREVIICCTRGSHLYFGHFEFECWIILPIGCCPMIEVTIDSLY